MPGRCPFGTARRNTRSRSVRREMRIPGRTPACRGREICKLRRHADLQHAETDRITHSQQDATGIVVKGQRRGANALRSCLATSSRDCCDSRSRGLHSRTDISLFRLCRSYWTQRHCKADAGESSDSSQSSASLRLAGRRTDDSDACRHQRLVCWRRTRLVPANGQVSHRPHSATTSQDLSS